MDLLAISMPGTTELLLIIFLVMLFFGVGKLPEVGSAIGRSIKNFKDAQKDDALDVGQGGSKGALPDAQEADEVGATTRQQDRAKR